RQAHGQPPLTMSVPLYNAAKGHSYDMGARRYFAHNTPEGVTPWDRIRAAGYGYNTHLGENIAAGSDSAQVVFDAWRSSAGHNANMLSANYRAIGIGRYYVPGSPYGYYWTTDFGGISVDNTPPTVSITNPGGPYADGIVNFTASATDNAGISKVDFYINDQREHSDRTAPYSYAWDTTGLSGNHGLRVVATDTAGLTSQATVQVTVSPLVPTDSYYFTWYDQSTSDLRNWVLMVNPATGQATARAAALVGGISQFDRELAAGAPAATPQFPGIMGGPVAVNATGPLITSQRVLYKNSFNEIPGVRKDDLESVYYFTWYDSNPANGMRGAWILIGNQGSTTAQVEVYIGGALKGTYSVPAGGKVTPSYANTTGGPLKVISTNGQPLIVSQRILYLNSFNEVLGVPGSRLGSEYDFTWYDSRRENYMKGNWILISNQDSGSATVEVFIGGRRMGTYNIPEGATITPQYEGVMDGPVKVISTNGKKLIVSQRILFKNSFEEFQGLTAADRGTDLWFTWYDSKRGNGMNGNWILVSNQGNSTANVNVYLGSSLLTQLSLPEGANIPLTFQDAMGGPVRVLSTNGVPIMATQRVLYVDSFNEIGGMQLR
ncbi:MAG: hypothetical protein IBX61_08630, partial [Thermoleophilia bacterium]|nr:hypothetical protein [Thermoleophilia bacterium]